MVHAETVPTGRRKITPAMLAALVGRPTRWEPTKKGAVLAALKGAAEPLGIARRVVDLIDTLMSHSQAADWLAGEGRIPCWPSNALLQDTLGIGPSQLKTLFRMAQELGLLEMHDSPTGKRFGHRDGQGRVTVAYGPDLSPLACRCAEFKRLAADRRAVWKEGEQLRAEITAMRNQVLSLADLGRDEEVAGDWEAVDGEARRLAATRGRSREPATLRPILAALADLRQGALDALTPSEPVNSDPVGPENWPLLTPTSHPSIAKANTEADGPSRPETLIQSRSTALTIQPRSDRAASVDSGTRERRQESALRGFAVSPAFVVQIAPSFALWSQKAAPSWMELLDTSTMVRHELGISQHAWGQACEVLGRIEAVVMLAAIDARRAAGEVQSPGGLLRKMVELHRGGTLRLDRTLFGLADKLKARMH